MSRKDRKYQLEMKLEALLDEPYRSRMGESLFEDPDFQARKQALEDEIAKLEGTKGKARQARSGPKAKSRTTPSPAPPLAGHPGPVGKGFSGEEPSRYGTPPKPNKRPRRSGLKLGTRIKAENRAHPFRTKAAGVASALGALYLLMKMLNRDQTEKQFEHSDRVASLEGQYRSMEAAAQLEQMRRRQAAQMNMARLQQMAPDIYQNVLAGRQLAPGEVVLGGRPREDMLAQVVDMMGHGEFRSPEQDDESQMMQLLA